MDYAIEIFKDEDERILKNLKTEIIKLALTWLSYARFVIQKIVTQHLYLVAIILLVLLALRDAMIVLFVVRLMKIS